MQTIPELTHKQLLNIYTDYYPKRDEDIKNILASTAKKISFDEIFLNGNNTSCHLQTNRGQRVLDVGCGTCESILEIKKLGGEAWGIDIDKNSQNVAKKLKLKFHLGTIADCPFPTKYFDLITCSQLLEHETDPIEFLNNCKRFLKPNGKIILSFPNTGSIYNKITRQKWINWHVPYHISHFNRKSFLYTAIAAGLKIKEIKTVTPNLWTLIQIRSLFSKTKLGLINPIWKNVSNEAGTPKRTKFYLFIQNIIKKFLFINRFVDFVDLGDSIVATVVNKND
jgi:ubiquinone/menaquinone biosynthesis C-methylase UbiE